VKGKTSEERRAFWQMAIEMQQESGLSVRKFCEREGLSDASYFSWRRKLRQEADEAGVDEPDDGEDAGESPRLVPVRLVGGGEDDALEVVSPSGLVLRVGGNADTESVRRLLQLMRDLG